MFHSFVIDTQRERNFDPQQKATLQLDRPIKISLHIHLLYPCSNEFGAAVCLQSYHRMICPELHKTTSFMILSSDVK